MGDLPNDVRTHYMKSGGYEILKRLLLFERTNLKPQIFIQ